MSYRSCNYTAFYVAEPFNQYNLGAYAAKDFCYYQVLKAWKAKTVILTKTKTLTKTIPVDS